MREVQLSQEYKARYDDASECFAIVQRGDKKAKILNRDEVSNFIDFACKMTQRKLAFCCYRCQPQQRFASLKGLVDHSEQAHFVHLVDFQRRLQEKEN